MKLKRIHVWFIISTIYCASCSLLDKETSQTRIHYFSKDDTSFLFPDEYRATKYFPCDFEDASESLHVLGEKKLYDIGSLKQYIRLSYWRSLDDPMIIIRIERQKAIIKSAPRSVFEKQRDSTALTENEWELLKAYHYYSENIDSSEIRKQLLTRFPELKNDRQKIMYLEFRKSVVLKEDSIVFTEKTKVVKIDFLSDLLLRLDSINFWSFDHAYLDSSSTDGSAFLLEAKNGDKYKTVFCDNCLEVELIYLRNVLLKLTNLKKENIY